ncbi:hypothetical protein L3Q82_014203 [Scortum barcoo]|uniref:Uncharacterized protein n=1 Tax=Scortum barcoo TaxID=214431 RepID=A0ACB8VVW5_9TELE|nr:hypothetical protein L3Q82_014203 [Scortum barcoo]
MDWLFWFSLLLTYLPVTGQMPKSCLSQPDEVIWREIGQSVSLHCTLSPHCSGLSPQWFVFKKNSHIRLDRNENRHMLTKEYLHINLLHANDSGIYYCAAMSHGVPTPGTQHVGLGTTLVVRENIKVMARYILLWVSFLLLAIYSLALVTLIIKKVNYLNMFIQNYGYNLWVCRKEHKNDKNNSTKKKQFHDVLQELYKRKNLERSKQTASRSRPKAGVGLVAVMLWFFLVGGQIE